MSLIEQFDGKVDAIHSSAWPTTNKARPSKTKVEIRFIPIPPLNFPVKSVMKSPARPTFNQPTAELKLKEFYLAAPTAGSVKLVADFTNWEKFPLDMIKSEDGVWFTTVPLSCGTYTYRFIVDGQWRDDPHSSQCAPNPFGTANAIVNII
jgi:hypothetical protein